MRLQLEAIISIGAFISFILTVILVFYRIVGWILGWVPAISWVWVFSPLWVFASLFTLGVFIFFFIFAFWGTH